MNSGTPGPVPSTMPVVAAQARRLLAPTTNSSRSRNRRRGDAGRAVEGATAGANIRAGAGVSRVVMDTVAAAPSVSAAVASRSRPNRRAIQSASKLDPVWMRMQSSCTDKSAVPNHIRNGLAPMRRASSSAMVAASMGLCVFKGGSVAVGLSSIMKRSRDEGWGTSEAVLGGMYSMESCCVSCEPSAH